MPEDVSNSKSRLVYSIPIGRGGASIMIETMIDRSAPLSELIPVVDRFSDLAGHEAAKAQLAETEDAYVRALAGVDAAKETFDEKAKVYEGRTRASAMERTKIDADYAVAEANLKHAEREVRILEARREALQQLIELDR